MAEQLTKRVFDSATKAVSVVALSDGEIAAKASRELEEARRRARMRVAAISAEARAAGIEVTITGRLMIGRVEGVRQWAEPAEATIRLVATAEAKAEFVVGATKLAVAGLNQISAPDVWVSAAWTRGVRDATNAEYDVTVAGFVAAMATYGAGLVAFDDRDEDAAAAIAAASTAEEANEVTW